jgi:hypothetical protein
MADLDASRLPASPRSRHAEDDPLVPASDEQRHVRCAPLACHAATSASVSTFIAKVGRLSR